MKSEDKFDVEIVPMPQWDNKLWVRVRFKNGQQQSWIPSFGDLRRIVVAIGYCEDQKYPRSEGFDGKWKVASFVADCIKGIPWPDLRRRYKIPEREQ